MADKKTVRILLVDKQVNFVKTLSARLKMRNLLVNTSTCSEDAVTKVGEQDYDAIVMDLSSPNRIDGFETTRRIKLINPTVPIIALTPYGCIETCAKALRIGVSDFLEKPVQVGKLVQKIAAAKLRRRRNRKAQISRPALPQIMPSFG